MLDDETLNELYNVIKYVILLNTDENNDCYISFYNNEISICIRCHWRNYHSMYVKDGWVYKNSWIIKISSDKDFKSCYNKLKTINKELSMVLNPTNWKNLVLKSSLESKDDLDCVPISVVNKLDLEKVKEELSNEHELNLDYNLIEDLTLDKISQLIDVGQNDSLYWKIRQPNNLYPNAVEYSWIIQEDSKYCSVTTISKAQYPTVGEWLNDK